MQVEREEHYYRCKGGVPGVTSPGVTGWKLPRTGWQSVTVEGCGLCVCCCDYTLCDRGKQPTSTGGTLQARHITSEERSSVLARYKTWCEQKARHSVSEVRQKTARVEHRDSSAVFFPKNTTRSSTTQIRCQAGRI